METKTKGIWLTYKQKHLEKKKVFSSHYHVSQFHQPMIFFKDLVNSQEIQTQQMCVLEQNRQKTLWSQEWEKHWWNCDMT